MVGAAIVETNDLRASGSKLFSRIDDALGRTSALRVQGRITSVVGQVLRASLPGVRLGELCHLHGPGGAVPLEAEVLGFVGEEVLLSPLGDIQGVSNATVVVPAGRCARVSVGDGLLGRIIDGSGRPIDRRGPLQGLVKTVPIYGDAPSPMARAPIEHVAPTGVRAIDATLTCAVGQRLGLFAAAGVGKSTLLGMLARGTRADVVVVGLVGERGREVREFIDESLGADGLRRSVVICATSDRTPMERARAALVATAIAEHFRDEGKSVLLLIDSITRYARAMRELGLSAGEPPARRGYPPSVFAALPRLLERAGNSDRGSITAFYTVLVEGDDMNEPVADETRSILDGHIILSRKLAEASRFPAIDVLQSVSRVMRAVVDEPHRLAAEAVRSVLAKFEEIELVVTLGEYEPGSDPAADAALRSIDAVRAFLRQDPHEAIPFDESVAALKGLLS